jgi:hypothetical protein
MEKDHLIDLGVDARIILEWICKKWDEQAWTEMFWLRIQTGDLSFVTETKCTEPSANISNLLN